jgi:hypothetical protein
MNDYGNPCTWAAGQVLAIFAVPNVSGSSLQVVLGLVVGRVQIDTDYKLAPPRGRPDGATWAPWAERLIVPWANTSEQQHAMLYNYAYDYAVGSMSAVH